MTELMWNAVIKNMKIDDKKELITRLLVSILKERGFPVGYLESEADSYFGYYIKNEDTVIPLDYAIDFQESNPEHISQLPISILANLLDKGQYKTDKDFDYLEKEKEFALQTIKEMKEGE